MIKTLSDCLELTIDRRGVTPKKLGSDWKKSGYKVLSANNIKTSGLQNMDEIRFVDEKTYKKWMKEEIRKGDIILTSEAPAGEVIYWDTDDKIVAGQRLYILRTKNDINPLFLKYYLQSEKGQIEIKNKCSGSTVFGISAKTFDSIQIVLPETKSQQDKIADILYTIDKKIENNKLIFDKIEKILKMIYDYWFIQYEFPNENYKPYKASGGSLYWNKTLKRNIPINWNNAKLGDILELLKDGTHNPPKRITSGIPLLTGTMFGRNFLNYKYATYIKEEDYKKIHTNYTPQKDDIIMTKIGTLGNVNYLTTRDLPLAIHCNSALLRFYSEYRGIYTLLFTKSDEFQSKLQSVKGKSIQEFVSLEKISNILIVNPDINIIKKFNSEYNSMLELQKQLTEETEKLISLRDFILPFLMNGKVKFNS